MYEAMKSLDGLVLTDAERRVLAEMHRNPITDPQKGDIIRLTDGSERIVLWRSHIPEKKPVLFTSLRPGLFSSPYLRRCTLQEWTDFALQHKAKVERIADIGIQSA